MNETTQNREIIYFMSIPYNILSHKYASDRIYEQDNALTREFVRYVETST